MIDYSLTGSSRFADEMLGVMATVVILLILIGVFFDR